MFDSAEVEVPVVNQGHETSLRPEQGEAIFEALYRREWSGLVALGWSLSGSWTAAEELAQDAFADAYRRWDKVGGLDKPGAWLRRAVINRSASFHRHRAVEERGITRLSSRADRDADGVGSDRTGDRATAQVSDPAFWAAVRSLPERQAASVALHYLEDRTVAETAEILGCRPATVKVHLHRARQTLAERLGAIDDGASHSDEQRTATDQGEERR